MSENATASINSLTTSLMRDHNSNLLLHKWKEGAMQSITPMDYFVSHSSTHTELEIRFNIVFVCHLLSASSHTPLALCPIALRG